MTGLQGYKTDKKQLFLCTIQYAEVLGKTSDFHLQNRTSQQLLRHETTAQITGVIIELIFPLFWGDQINLIKNLLN